MGVDPTVSSDEDADGDALAVLDEADDIRESVRRLTNAAEDALSLSLPVDELSSVRSALDDAIDRGVLTLLLLHGADRPLDVDLDGVATVARLSDRPLPLTCAVDYSRGLNGHGRAFRDRQTETDVTVVADNNVAHTLYGEFMGNYWPMAEEVYTAPPSRLPLESVDFRQAVLQSTLRLREGERVSLRGTVQNHAGERHTIRGPIVNVRQSIVYPLTSAFPVENNLVVDTDDGKVSVGGEGAFLEDYEALDVSLHPRE